MDKLIAYLIDCLVIDFLLLVGLIGQLVFTGFLFDSDWLIRNVEKIQHKR